MSINLNGEVYTTLDDYLNDPAKVSKEERAEIELEAALIGELIHARKAQGLSQRELGALSGVKQPVIARMESGVTIPNLSTVLKVLVPLGKTLYIGDLNNQYYPMRSNASAPCLHSGQTTQKSRQFACF